MADNEKTPEVRSKLHPRWRRVPKTVEVLELEDEFENEIAPAVASFIDEAEAKGLPTPEPRQVIDRIRHILRHGGEGQDVVLLSRGRPPYFGVTTEKAVTVTRRENG